MRFPKGESQMLSRTPQIAAEVRRNLFLWLFAFACCVALVSGLLLSSVDSTSLTPFQRVRAVAFAAIPFAMESAMLLILAYPMGCWGAFIRAGRLPDLLGIPSDSVSGRVLSSSRQGEPGFRTAFDKGGKLGVLFMMLWIVLLGTLRLLKMDLVELLTALIFVFSAAAVSIRAWEVQRAVEERDARTAGESPVAAD